MKTFKVLSWYASTALLIGTLADADVVTDWNNAALDAIRDGHTPPPIASRSLAIAHVSIYDAVNGIARTHEPYLVQSAVPASASREAAASAAAHEALVNLFPASAANPRRARQRWFRRHRAAAWGQWSWGVDPDSSGISSLFAAAMGICCAVWNERQLAIPSAWPAFTR